MCIVCDASLGMDTKNMEGKEREVRKIGMEEEEARKKVKELGDNKKLYARSCPCKLFNLA
jgi:hypothetical protein